MHTYKKVVLVLICDFWVGIFCDRYYSVTLREYYETPSGSQAGRFDFKITTKTNPNSPKNAYILLTPSATNQNANVKNENLQKLRVKNIKQTNKSNYGGSIRKTT